MSAIAQTPAQKRKTKIMLFALVAVFVLPLAVAWLYVGGVLDWRSRGTVNHGTLLTEPIRLEQTLITETAVRLSGYNGTWSIIYLGEQSCQAVCRESLGNVIKVHQLIGRDQPRVKLFRMGSGADETLPEELSSFQELPVSGPAASGIAASVQSQTGVTSPFIALVDWRGALIMVYPAAADPNGLLEDLKLLLRASNPG